MVNTTMLPGILWREILLATAANRRPTVILVAKCVQDELRGLPMYITPNTFLDIRKPHWLYHKVRTRWTPEMADAILLRAAAAGNEGVCRFCYRHKATNFNAALRIAATHRHTRIMGLCRRWLWETNQRPDYIGAIENAGCDMTTALIVSWLQQSDRVRHAFDQIRLAAQTGDLPRISRYSRKLVRRGIPVNWQGFMLIALLYRQYELVEWLSKQGNRAV